MKVEGLFEAKALRILRGIPGLEVISRPGPPDRLADATIRFAGTRARVAVEIRRRANAATAWQLIQQARSRPDTPLLLIADEITAEARRILEDRGVAVVDGLGNAHIELPGLLFHLEGRHQRPRPATGTPPTRLTGKAGVAAQALLLQPERAWRVQDLAEVAHVSLGLAHRVMARLEREGAMTAEGVGPKRVRRVTTPPALLDLWVEEGSEHPTVTLAHVLAQTPKQLIEKIGTHLKRSGIRYALTGAAGASLVAPYVTAIPMIDLWAEAKAAPEGLCRAVDGDQVSIGQNVAFLQEKDDAPLAFREEVRGVWLANRFRIYADLRRDPRRGREQADHLRREVIGF